MARKRRAALAKQSFGVGVLAKLHVNKVHEGDAGATGKEAGEGDLLENRAGKRLRKKRIGKPRESARGESRQGGKRCAGVFGL